MKIMLAVFGLLISALSQAAPVAGDVSLTLTQVTRTDGKVDVALSWNTTPRADGCVSTGAWTGSRSASRDAASPVRFTGVTPPAEYTLTCRWDDKDALLTWTAPTKNEDGTNLTNLAGYRVYYGTDPANLSNTLNITTAGATSQVIAPLAAGVWHFAMTALNTDGKESARSAQVAATLGSATSAATKTAIAAIPVPAAPTGLVVNPEN